MPRTTEKGREKAVRRMLLVLVCLIFFPSGCAERAAVAPLPDGKGLAGKRSGESELLFAKAHVLWKGDACTDPEKAIRILDELVARDPDYGAAWALRGLARSELGEREEAFEDSTRAVRLDPTAEHYAYRGLVSLRAGALSAARKDLEYSLKKAPKQHRAWNLTGILALREGDAERACAAFDEGCSNGDCGPLSTARAEGRCK
jgi:tetratricopeptide (TPR) repeat protein